MKPKIAKLVEFQQGQPRGLDQAVFVNPEEISALLPVYQSPGGDSPENRCIIVMKNGERILVRDSPGAVMRNQLAGWYLECRP